MTAIGYGNSLRETMYRAGVILEAERATPLSAFVGSGDGNALVLEERPGNKRGDTVKIRFAKANDTAPITSTATILGQEESTTYYEDSVNIRYFGYTGSVDNIPASQNNVSFNLKDGERSRIALQWAYNREKSIINQLVGNTLLNSDADYGRSGGNIVTAQDTNHLYWAPDSSGANTTDALVAADDTAILTTRVIDDLVTRAVSSDYVEWPIAPAETPLGPLYVFVVHPTGYQQIRTNSAASDCYDLQRALLEAGLEPDDSPLFNGEGFIYNNTLVLRSDFCPQGITSAAAQANSRVGAFFGARAGHVVYGEGFTDGNHLGWAEHVQLRRWSCLSDTIWGVKRTIVNDVSWGAFRVAHYSAV